MHILIVDDEPLARNELTYLIHQISKHIKISEADDSESALAIIEGDQVDGVFLDIHLTSENGLDVAQAINNLADPPAIIFATAYDEYAVKAFERDAIDYILKPFTLERVSRTIQRLAFYMEQQLKAQSSSRPFVSHAKDRIPIEAGDKIIILPIEEILAIEVLKGETTLYTKDKKYYDNQPLIKWERKLTDHPFIRVHRSYLIQINAIREVQPWFNQTYQITLVNGMKIPVSRSYLKVFKESLGLS